jgi:hypothetical protein
MDKKIKISQKFTIMDFDCPFAENINAMLEKEIRESGDAQNQKTLCKCYMTDFLMRTPAFEYLKKYILSCVSANCPNASMWNGSWEVTNMWGLIYKKGDYSKEHDHDPAIYSFVYFVNCPSGSSPLKFHGHKINPKDGNLIIFPSNLRHWVPVHKLNKDRIVISGNLNVSTEFIRKYITYQCP